MKTITMSALSLNDAPNPAIRLTNITTAIEPEISEQVMPTSYDLVAAYPNPFNPSTRIVFRMPSFAPVRLEVYSPVGVKVKTLLDGPLTSGQHEVQWDGTNNGGGSVASGPYFCVMRSGGFTKTLGILLLK